MRSRLTEALRKKYRKRGEALAALGLDASVIEERGKEMVKPLTVEQSGYYVVHLAQMEAQRRARSEGQLARLVPQPHRQTWFRIRAGGPTSAYLG
jgi:hypothetical protein